MLHPFAGITARGCPPISATSFARLRRWHDNEI
jgi:hypothetical protein